MDRDSHNSMEFAAETSSSPAIVVPFLSQGRFGEDDAGDRRYRAKPARSVQSRGGLEKRETNTLAYGAPARQYMCGPFAFPKYGVLRPSCRNDTPAANGGLLCRLICPRYGGL